MRQLRNHTEEAVRLYVERNFPRDDYCGCEGCKLDIMAIMLNNMPQRFVVTDQGEMYAKMSDFDPQYRTDLMVNMEMAVKAVAKLPKHCEHNPSRRV